MHKCRECGLDIYPGVDASCSLDDESHVHLYCYQMSTHGCWMILDDVGQSRRTTPKEDVDRRAQSIRWLNRSLSERLSRSSDAIVVSSKGFHS